MEKRDRRHFTPEQKFAMLQDIETCPTVKEGLDKYQLCHSLYQKWKRQLAVGVRASLRNSKPLKAPDLRRLVDAGLLRTIETASGRRAALYAFDPLLDLLKV